MIKISKEWFTNYDELPLMLSVVELSKLLGISRAGAYDLVRQESFPSIKIGTRIIIPKDKLLEWIEEKSKEKC